MRVQAYFLGEPRLIIRGREVQIERNMLEALLFYLLYYETIDRNEVSSIFWPEKDPVRGRSSLRNSLYEIRRSVGADLFSASTRERIAISPEMELEKDVDMLLDRRSPVELRSLKGFVFMQNRGIRHNDDYDAWLSSMRRAYLDVLSGLLKARLSEVRKTGESALVYDIARQIILLEPYNEAVLRVIMEHFADLHQYNDALAWYRQVVQQLSQDLDVDPEPDTVKLAEYIEQMKGSAEESSGRGFQRSALMVEMNRAFQKFKAGQRTDHLLVYGDPGSGRQSLINSFLSGIGMKTVTLEMDPSDRKIPGAFTRKWLDALGSPSLDDPWDLRDRLPHEPLIIIVNDLEFVDDQGLIALTSFMNQRQDKILLLVKACQAFLGGNQKFIRLTQKCTILKIHVPLLTKPELMEYLSSYSKETGRDLVKEEKEKIYALSRGNIRIINEMIQPGPGLEPFFLELTAILTDEEMETLEHLSIYEEGIPPAMLGDISGPSAVLLKRLKGLVEKGLLEAEGDLLKIRYPLLKKWLYEGLPSFYQKQAHREAARRSGLMNLPVRKEAQFRAGHLDKAGDEQAALEEHLLALEHALAFYDEMYPSKVDLLDPKDNYVKTRLDQFQHLHNVSDRILKFLETDQSPEGDLMEIRRRFLMGRRYIAAGEKEQGIQEIRTLLKLCQETGNQEYLLYGYVAYIHYAIQTDDPALMHQQLQNARELLEGPFKGDLRWRAVLKRLSGLYHYSIGEYEEARKQLMGADGLFKDSKLRKDGFLGRAGTLNYLARTLDALGDEAGADEAYLTSVRLVEGRVHKCLDTLYSDYGRFLWQKGRESEAEEILQRARQEFDLLGTHWRRPATEAILGLIHLNAGEREAARRHLLSAQIYHRAERLEKDEELITKLASKLRES